MAGEPFGTFDQFAEVFVKENTGKAGVVWVFEIDVDGGKGFASEKDVVADGGDAVGDGDGGEGSAVFEGVASDPDNAAGKGDGGEG